MKRRAEDLPPLSMLWAGAAATAAANRKGVIKCFMFERDGGFQTSMRLQHMSERKGIDYVALLVVRHGNTMILMTVSFQGMLSVVQRRLENSRACE